MVKMKTQEAEIPSSLVSCLNPTFGTMHLDRDFQASLPFPQFATQALCHLQPKPPGPAPG